MFSALIVGCAGENSKDNKPNENKLEETDNIASSEPQKSLSIEEIKSNIENSNYLAGVHFQKGISCEECHGEIIEDKALEISEDSVCLECHGSYESLAEKLKNKEDWEVYNPHYSPHGRESCVFCHKAHQPFDLSCSYCHSVSVPERFK